MITIIKEYNRCFVLPTISFHYDTDLRDGSYDYFSVDISWFTRTISFSLIKTED